MNARIIVFGLLAALAVFASFGLVLPQQAAATHDPEACADAIEEAANAKGRDARDAAAKVAENCA